MAAKNYGGGKRNYYTIAYGKLSTKVKELLVALEEISKDELKSKTFNIENIDLRNKFVKGSGDYPFSVFYDSITGDIVSIAKDVYDKGTSLKIEMLDEDGDTSFIAVKFYSKYTENILNRICNLKSLQKLMLVPYSIPSEYEGLKFYNQGASIILNGVKTDSKYNKDNGLPALEKVQDAEGKDVTSRVKRINFLFEKAMGIISQHTTLASNDKNANTAASAQPIQTVQPNKGKPIATQETPKNVDIKDNPFGDDGDIDELPF